MFDDLLDVFERDDRRRRPGQKTGLRGALQRVLGESDRDDRHLRDERDDRDRDRRRGDEDDDDRENRPGQRRQRSLGDLFEAD